MKKITFLLVALVVGVAHSAVVDGIAAKVNDIVITVSDVMAEMHRNPNAREVFSSGREDAAKKLYLEALDSLINRKLILKAAVDKDMQMQEWVIDNRVREVVKMNFDGDMNKLVAALAETKTPLTEWRNNIRDDLVIQAMRYQMVEKDIVPTPGAMKKEYESNKHRYAQKAGVTVSVILLKPSDTDSVEARSKKIFERLAKGEKFADLARQFSSDSKASTGGQWKDVKPEEAFRQEIVDEIAKLKVGERSKLLNLDGWGFIVQKDAEKLARELSFEEAYDDVAANVRREEAMVRFEEWTKRLRAEAYVKVYSLPEEIK